MTGPDEAAGRWQWAGAEGAVLVYRDDTGAQLFFPLEGATALTIGRGSGCDVRLAWDERVSRVHAALERVGSDWALVDDGLSRNGTFLNGERLTGRRRLHDGDTFVLGSTSFRFRDTSRGATKLTKVGEQLVPPPRCRRRSGRSSPRCAGRTSTTTRTRPRRPTSRSPTSCSSASTR